MPLIFFDLVKGSYRGRTFIFLGWLVGAITHSMQSFLILALFCTWFIVMQV
jgi:hypothetical protein